MSRDSSVVKSVVDRFLSEEVMFQHSDFPIKLSVTDVRYLKEYPHYFFEFLRDKKLLRKGFIDREVENVLFDKCDDVLRCIERDEDRSAIDLKKEEVYDFILDDFACCKLIHRFVEDYLIPLERKQRVVDMMKRGERVPDDLNTDFVWHPEGNRYAFKKFLLK